MPRHIYTAEEVEYLRYLFRQDNMYPSLAVVKFNEKFGASINTESIQGAKKRYKIQSKKLPPINRLLTKEQEAWLRENVEGKWSSELVVMLKEKFGVVMTLAQMRAYKKNNNMPSGIDAKFRKGMVSNNKGKKVSEEAYRKSQPTMFKPGNRPKNTAPVGTEVVRGKYIYVKVAEPNKWQSKHRLVYESVNGPVPKGGRVIFADGDTMNLAPENLLLVTNAELRMLNLDKLIFNNREATEMGLKLAKLKIKMFERKKEGKKDGG